MYETNSSCSRMLSSESLNATSGSTIQNSVRCLRVLDFALGKIYCFGPTFRAEKSKTRRHLTEFWMVEPEVAFNDSDDNMRLQEDFVSYLVARALERRQPELKELERDVSKLENIKPPFPRVDYSEAVKILQTRGSS